MSRRPPTRRAGFSLVELAIVVLIVSIVAAIAIPQLQSVLLRARATEAVGDLQVVRVAVLNYQADNGVWPPDDRVGVIPSGLADYLPEGYSFTKERYTLNYDNWSSNNPKFIAVTVETADDPDLGNAMLQILGANAWTNGSFKFTWVIEWLE